MLEKEMFELFMGRLELNGVVSEYRSALLISWT